MEKRGIVGDIVQVKRGFARNFLIPRKKAGKYWLSVCYYFATHTLIIQLFLIR